MTIQVTLNESNKSGGIVTISNGDDRKFKLTSSLFYPCGLPQFEEASIGVAGHQIKIALRDNSIKYDWSKGSGSAVIKHAGQPNVCEEAMGCAALAAYLVQAQGLKASGAINVVLSGGDKMEFLLGDGGL